MSLVGAGRRTRSQAVITLDLRAHPGLWRVTPDGDATQLADTQDVVAVVASEDRVFVATEEGAVLVVQPDDTVTSLLPAYDVFANPARIRRAP